MSAVRNCFNKLRLFHISFFINEKEHEKNERKSKIDEVEGKKRKQKENVKWKG